MQSKADVAKAKADEAVARARQETPQADLSRVKGLPPVHADSRTRMPGW